MKGSESVESVDQSFLTNPEQGRIYLKQALEKNQEEVFLEALHNIIDSFADLEPNLSDELTILPA